MHVTDSNLKLLIDVVALALDDDLDDLGDDWDVRRVMEEREDVLRAWALKDLLGLLREESKARRARGTARDFELSEVVVAPPSAEAVESALRFARGEGPENGGDDVKRAEDADDPIHAASAPDALSESVRSLRLEIGDVRSSLMGFADWARPMLTKLDQRVNALQSYQHGLEVGVTELRHDVSRLQDHLVTLQEWMQSHAGSSEVKH